LTTIGRPLFMTTLCVLLRRIRKDIISKFWQLFGVVGVNLDPII
jgi:hypothetical protein